MQRMTTPDDFKHTVKSISKRFSNNSQLCHVWAQQTQPEGKGNSLFFEGSKIYSFGYHYTAAEIHTVKGKRVALINSYRYSSRTGKHLNDIFRAVNTLYPVFHVPNVTKLNSQENINHFFDKIFDHISMIFSTVKVENVNGIKYPLERLSEIETEVNEFFSLIGKAKISVPKDLKNCLEEHLENRMRRTVALSSPEAIEKRNQERLKREEKNIDKILAAKDLWKKTGDSQALSIIRAESWYFENDFFRVSGDKVITQRGATVPLVEAVAIVKKLIRKSYVERGETVGHFSVETVNTGNDKIKIGCHTFSISESIESLKDHLEPQPELKLITAEKA